MIFQNIDDFQLEYPVKKLVECVFSANMRMDIPYVKEMAKKVSIEEAIYMEQG